MAAATPVDAGVPEIPKASIEGVNLEPAPALPKPPAFLGDAPESADNPTTPEKAALGYQLFFEKRLSKSGTMSCESCHHPDKAWTSGEQIDKKDNGTMNKRNAPTMLNVGYHQNGWYWDGRAPTMEKVSNAAWTGQLGAVPADVVAKLNAIAVYRAAFQRAFQQDASPDNVPKALAAFLRSLKGGDAPWDKYEQGDKKAVSSQAIRGHKVFEEAHCALCHVPPLYTDTQFHATGAGSGEDHGRMDATKDAKDDGKFKTPTLREVAKTGPYFHDGSAKDLATAVDFMLSGGKPGPNHDEKLKPAKVTPKDRDALVAFIESLSGTATYSSAPTLP
jgi:cytochrome c peroxidase